MRVRIACGLAAVAGSAVLAGQMKAGDQPQRRDLSAGRSEAASEGGAPSGPDVAVCDIPTVARYGTVGGITAYSIATRSVNLGDENLNWIDNTPFHPVIGQNMFRLTDSRIEHIGQSWIKHGLCAFQLNGCGTCETEPGCFPYLKPGCSDPYSVGLNGFQPGMGPKFEVNAANGAAAWPFTGDGVSGDAIYKRLQVHNVDLEPSLNPGALYFVEAQYVARDDAVAGNKHNNAAYRRVSVGNAPFDILFAGSTVQQPAIRAWQDHGLGPGISDPDVTLVNIDVPEDGRFILGYKVSDNGDGTWHYEYAIQNLNSDRSGASLIVPVPAGVTVSNVGFHDVDYHSGEPFAGTDWGVTIGGGSVMWATQTETENADANALRWGTLYNFRFDADAPPGAADVEIGLFRAAAAPLPGSMTVAAEGPAPVCPQDINGDGATDVLDLIDLLLCFGLPAVPGCENEDVNGDSTIDVLDLIDLLLAFGTTCP